MASLPATVLQFMSMEGNLLSPRSGALDEGALQSESVIKQRQRAIVATIVGNALEWFDFASYAFLAGAIAENFFPAGGKTAVLIKVFAAFGVGYIARPVGAVFFGRFGDVQGRRLALLLSMPMMGLGTLIVGATPSYGSIGMLAPVLLVFGRVMQGFAAGGEVGNAMAFLTEWAPPNRRAFYSGLEQSTSVLGTIVGAGLAGVITTMLPAQELLAWGWRLPFLVGGLVVTPLGMLLRGRIEETPVFESEAASDCRRGLSRKAILVRGIHAILLAAGWVTAFYTYLIYLATYLPTFGHVSARTALWANTVGLIVDMITISSAGIISDRIGRRLPLFFASILGMLLPFPMFHVLAGHPTTIQVYLSVILGAIVTGTFAGVAPAATAEIFPTFERTTGVSISFGIATAVYGGMGPLICTYLIRVTKSTISPAAFVFLGSVISMIAVWYLRETAYERLE